MSDLGRILISLGLLLVVIGLIVVVFTRLNLPLGRLPGDFTWRGRGWSFSFPLATSILVSVVLSLILWTINHFRR
jgi:ribose/xylose/arabinose/galactoside ABC-type transport system permease subunit